MRVATSADGIGQQHSVQPGVDDAISGAKRNSTACHDEIRQIVLCINIYWFGVCGSMTKGLHGQVGGEAQTSQIFQLIPSHGAGSILGSDGGHPRLTVGSGSNTLNTAGAADHLLAQREALAGIHGDFWRAKHLGLGQSQTFSRTGCESAPNDQVYAPTGPNLVQQDIGLEFEFR